MGVAYSAPFCPSAVLIAAILICHPQKSVTVTAELAQAAVHMQCHMVAADVKNYRPVSNLTFVSKVVERFISGRLVGYLQENYNLMPVEHSAYRRNHSTETASINCSGSSPSQLLGQTRGITLLGLSRSQCRIRLCRS